MTATATDSRLALGIIAEALGDVHGMTDEELGAMARAVLSEIGIRDVTMATVPSLTTREWDLLVEGLARFVEDHRAAMTGAPVATVECPAWCTNHQGDAVDRQESWHESDQFEVNGVQCLLASDPGSDKPLLYLFSVHEGMPSRPLSRDSAVGLASLLAQWAGAR